MNYREIAKQASRWGQTVARTLEVNKAGDPVHPDIRRRFQQTLDKALETPQKAVEPQLLAIVRDIRQMPELQASLALMESFWRLPSGTQLESGVVRVIQRCYMECRRKPTEFERLDNALRESQWSPFPAVRRVAHKVRQMVPVSEPELRFLGNFDRSYTDLRLAVADRVLRHRQLEHLDPVLAYLTGVLTGDRLDPREVREVRELFRLLRGFETSQEFLLLIFRHYQANYFRSSDVRGRLMPVLSAAKDSLVPALLTLWQQADQEISRTPIVRLLQQMVEFGSQEAVDALGEIVWKSQGRELGFACQCLREGAATQAAHGMRGLWSKLIRQRLEELADRLDESYSPEHVELRSQLRNLPWDAQQDREWIRKIIAEGFIDKDIKRLRAAGYMEYEILKSAILDGDQPTDNRRRAITAVTYMNRELVQRMGLAFLWRLYEEDEDPELRAAALQGLADLEFKLDDWMAERLVQDQREAEGRLRQVIDTVRETLVEPQRPARVAEEVETEHDTPWGGLADEPAFVDGASDSAPLLTSAGDSLEVVIFHAEQDRAAARSLYARLGKTDSACGWRARICCPARSGGRAEAQDPVLRHLRAPVGQEPSARRPGAQGEAVGPRAAAGPARRCHLPDSSAGRRRGLARGGECSEPVETV